MYVWRFISIFIYLCRRSHTYIWQLPSIERYYYPGIFTTAMTVYVNGTSTQIASRADTPDYRVEESMYVMYNERRSTELNRPMRNSPPYKQAQRAYSTYYYWKATELAIGCTCCTVYLRDILLSTCAVITTRHILTTATPTVFLLRQFGDRRTLTDILGGWYDTNRNVFNASMYFTPARIHIHPMYRYDYEVNVSHPIPCMYDLSVWAATYRFYSDLLGINKVILCERAASGWFEYTSSYPRWNDIYTVAGYQFMKAYKRRPMPWFRYIVKTKDHQYPCPKTEWQWYYCVKGEYWGRFGFDSGGCMHATLENKGWRRDGLAALCAFSMNLRARQLLHYFTVIDTWPVLDFLYDAILGLIRNVYLDGRFEDTKYGAPVAFWGEYIAWNYWFGYEYYYPKGWIPKYRR